MRVKLFLTFLFLICFEALCQETVFIKAVENGNGFTKERAGECFIITPNHVVLENFGDVRIVAKNRLELKGELIESFEPDLAILKLEESTNFNCKPWQKNEDINELKQHSFFFDDTIPVDNQKRSRFSFWLENDNTFTGYRCNAPLDRIVVDWDGSSFFCESHLFSDTPPVFNINNKVDVIIISVIIIIIIITIAIYY